MLLRTRAIARKEFIQIVRDARTLGVVIALPLLMLIIYGYAINTDVRNLPMAVLDQDQTAQSRDLIRTFEHTGFFDIKYYVESPDEIDEVIRTGEVKLALTIPRGFAKAIANGETAYVQPIIDGSDSTTASIGSGYVVGVLQSYSGKVALVAARRAGIAQASALQPIDFQPRVWYNPELKSTNFIVPGLIAVILMMLAALLTSMTVVRERERGTIEQLIVSPIKPTELMLGKLAPYVIIAFVDVLIIIGVGRLLFNVPLNGSPTLLLVLSVIYLISALAIGLLISTVSGTQQTAMAMAMMATQLPSVLLSGFIFPIASMPLAIRVITRIIPARYFLVIVRGIFLKGVGLAVLWQQAVFLVIFACIILGLCSRRFRKTL